MSRCILGLYEKAQPDAVSLEEKLVHAAQAGFDSFELSVDESDQRLARLEWGPDKISALRQAARRAGVSVATLCLSGHRRYPLGSADPGTVRRGMDILHRAIALAGELGVRLIQLAGYDVYYERSTPDTVKRFADNLLRGVEWAAAAGVMLGLCAVTGTWSINEYISRSPVAPDGTTLNSLFCLPEYYLIEESSPTSAGNLSWAVKRFLGEAQWAELHNGGSPYTLADRLVDALDPADSSVIFLPFLYGSNVSGVEQAVLAGLNQTHGTADLLRAVFEGVVYSHRTHIDRLRAHNPRLDRLRLAGGAARSAVWVQMFADALAMPVEVIGAEELGAKGAAMAAAVAAGVYTDFREAAGAMVGIAAAVEPNPAYTAVYAEKYARYRRLAEALRMG